MPTSWKAGERVRWSSSGGESVGKVVRKVTKPTRVKGHVAKASRQRPEYLVRSETSGQHAVHRPQALRKA